MKNAKGLALVTVGLVAGLVLGSLTIASAAPAADPATDEPLGFGARIGWTMRDAGARLVDVLADLTGLDADEIHDRRVDGESLADIAADEGVDASTLTEQALTARETILDEKVADGTITAEDKAAILERMTERMDDRVDSIEVGPMGYGGCGGGGCGAGASGGRGGGRGPGGMGLQDGSCYTQ